MFSTRPSFLNNEQGHVAGYCIDRSVGLKTVNVKLT